MHLKRISLQTNYLLSVPIIPECQDPFPPRYLLSAINSSLYSFLALTSVPEAAAVAQSAPAP